MFTRFVKLSPDTWRTIQFGAGILLIDTSEVELSDFEKLQTAQYANILGATTGGVNIKVTPNFIASSLGGLDNVYELSVIRNYNISVTGKLVTINENSLQVLVGTEEVERIAGHDDKERISYQVQFNNSLPVPTNIWWVGNYGNDTSDAPEDMERYIAIHICNALSKGGFSLQTTHAAKGEFDFNFEAMYTIADVNSKNMPLEAYFINTARYTCFMVKKDTASYYDPFYVKECDNDTVGVFFKVPPSGFEIEEELRALIFS